ncbi:MAG: hypothetical protein D6B28_07950 [Gammaproteobacteria bacterium]|nr:MAG: hypothetical protein D6B28_07950 [Gammaproteobacteria bacterium]
MKQLFYFYGYRLKVLRWQKGAVIAANVFEPNAEGFASFREFVKDYKNIKTMMLVDIIEEDFHTDLIPKVSGRDREALIERSLNNSFHDVTYRCALSHGKSQIERGKEEILLGALTNTELLSPWLSEIRRQSIRLVGIQSVSTVGESLLPKIGLEDKPSLLITQQLPWTIRFSFYKHNKLYFSRLIPTRLNDISEFPGVVLSEIDSTIRYLQYKRLTNESERINTTLILAEEYAEQINQALQSNQGFDLDVITVPEVADMLGIKQPLESTTADILFAHISGLKAKNHYGRNDDLLCHNSHSLKNFLYGLSTAIAIGGLGLSAYLGINSVIFDKNAESAKQSAQIFQQKYEQQSLQLDELLDNAEIMKQSVDAVGKLTRDRTYPPATLLSTFSEVLTKYPQIKLDRVNISYDSGMIIPDPSNPASMKPNPEPPNPTYPKPILQIDASLIGMEKDYRESLKLVAKFKNELDGLQQTTKVEVTKQPVEITPQTQFSGSTGFSPASSDKTQNQNSFSIKITFDQNMPKEITNDPSLNANVQLNKNGTES